MKLRRLIFPVLMVSMGMAAGCEQSDRSSSKPRRDRDSDEIADRYDRRDDDLRRDDERGDVIGRDPDRRETSRDTRTSDRRGLSEVPREAAKVEEGVGDTLRYGAERDGRIYVYDADDDRVVYSGNLYRGENFVVDPKGDVLSVGGKRLREVNLRAQHRYHLYFMRD